MPLKAIVEGETITGPDLSAEEWERLRIRHKKGLLVTMACCGEPGHLRRSKNGTQHFYHATAAGCAGAEESQEHLELKHLIYRTCRAEGWETVVEFPGPDRTWVSDVYATRDGRKVVFEVQISPISPADLEFREAKYRNEGIESYWLLDHFLDRSRDFESWYLARLCEEDGPRDGAVPYIDDTLFRTGPENHLFIAKGIRSIGLDAGKQSVFTTSNPAIPVAIWVREALKGTYRRYLDETAASWQRKRELRGLAAPALLRFRDFSNAIVRYETYREQVRPLYQAFRSGDTSPADTALNRKFDAIYAEIEWLESEYRSCIAESSGMFAWKKQPGRDHSRPVFRLDSEAAIRKLQACVDRFSRWEDSFHAALDELEREAAARK